MFRQITIEQRMYAAGMADTEVDSLKLAKLQCIENAHEVLKKTFRFLLCDCYMYNYWGQNRYGLV